MITVGVWGPWCFGCVDVAAEQHCYCGLHRQFAVCLASQYHFMTYACCQH
jgi:hypothetical protein